MKSEVGALVACCREGVGEVVYLDVLGERVRLPALWGGMSFDVLRFVWVDRESVSAVVAAIERQLSLYSLPVLQSD